MPVNERPNRGRGSRTPLISAVGIGLISGLKDAVGADGWNSAERSRRSSTVNMHTRAAADKVCKKSCRKGVRSNWAGPGYWARSQCGGTRPHCGPPVRYLRIALRDKTLPHCGGKRPHCGKNRPQCGVKIDRTAVRDDRTAVGKSTALRSESTALRSESTALIDRTAASAARHRPHCCARRTAAVAKARTGSRKASAEREVHASDWLKEDAH